MEKPFPEIPDLNWKINYNVNNYENFSEFSNKKLVHYDPEFLKTQYEIDPQHKFITKSVGICTITSLFATYSYLFDNSVDEVRKFLSTLTNVNNSLEIIKKLNEKIKKEFGVKDLLYIETKHIDKTIIKSIDNDCPVVMSVVFDVKRNNDRIDVHSVAILGYDEESYYIHDNGENGKDILVKGIINCIYTDLDKAYRNHIPMLYPKYKDFFEFREKWGNKSRDKDYWDNVIDIISKHFARHEGNLTCIAKDFIYDNMDKVQLLALKYKLAKRKKLYDFSFLEYRINMVSEKIKLEDPILPDYNFR